MYRQQIDRMAAPMLGKKWYEYFTGYASDALNLYSDAKQKEAYERALSALTSQKAVDYSKYLIIGGFAIAAVVILTRKKN